MRWLLWCFCLLAESYETINHYHYHEVSFLHSGRGVPQNSGKLLSVPWVKKDCGVAYCSGRHNKLRDDWYCAPVGAPLQGDVNKFPGGVSPYAPYHMESLINKFTNKYIFFTIRGAWNTGQLLKNHCYTLNSNHSRTSFSTQVVSCSRHLCRMCDARVGNHTHAKRTLTRKKLQAKFKYICTEQNRK